MVGDERARGGAARDGLHHGRLHLQEVVGFQEAPHGPDETRADLEDGTGARVGQEVQVALPCARLTVRQPVVLLRQGAERLGQHLEPVHRDAQLAGAGAEEAALHADDVAQVEQLEDLPRGAIQVLAAEVELEARGAVREIGEGHLAVTANGPHPARHTDTGRILLQVLGGGCLEALTNAADGLPDPEPGRVGLDAQIPQLLQLGPAVREEALDRLLGDRVAPLLRSWLPVGLLAHGHPRRTRDCTMVIRRGRIT